MKKTIILLAILFTVSINAQQKSWAIEAGAGAHSFVNSLSSSELFLNVNGDVRYMFNNKFGIGLYGAFDNLESTDTYCPYDSNFYRASLEGVMNLGRVLKFETFTKNFTMLLHGGAGAGYFNNDLYDKVTFNITGGVTGLYRLNNSLALRADVSSIGIVGQEMTLNADHFVNTNGTDAYLHTYSLGLSLYLGKGKEHKDWYIEPKEEKETIIREIETIREVGTEKVIHEQVCCEEKLTDNIYFEEGSDKIGIHALNELQKVVDYANEHPKANFDLVGSACTVHGNQFTDSGKTWNKVLSENRAYNVYSKLISMGIDPSRLTHWGIGRDNKYIGEPNSDLAKRVEIRIKQ